MRPITPLQVLILAASLLHAPSFAQAQDKDDADVTVDTGKLTKGNLIISSGGVNSFGPCLFEYDLEGDKQLQVSLPRYGAETSRPHDLVIGGDGRAHFFQGHKDGKFAAWNPRNGVVAVKRYPGMGMPDDVTDGAVAAIKQWVFAVSDAKIKGVIRFDLQSNKVDRFNFEALDLANGYDGFLYVLSRDGKTLTKVDPGAMRKVGSVELNPSRAVAVDQLGRIWASGQDGYLYHYPKTGRGRDVLKSHEKFGVMHDLDVTGSGHVWVAGAIGNSEIVLVRGTRMIVNEPTKRIKVRKGSTLFVAFVQPPPGATLDGPPPSVAVVPPKPAPVVETPTPPKTKPATDPPTVPTPARTSTPVDELAPLTPGGILLNRTNPRTNRTFIEEVNAEGTRVQVVPIDENGAGKVRGDGFRDLAIGSDDRLHAFHGIFEAQLIAIKTGSRATSHSSKTTDGLGIVNNGRFGAVAALGEYLFTVDSDIDKERTQGIVRFNVADGPPQRMPGPQPQDLAAGHDGFLYALLTDETTVQVIHPQSLTVVRTIKLSTPRYCIAVHASGRIYAGGDGGVTSHEPDGTLIKRLEMDKAISLADIDLNIDGRLVCTHSGGKAFVVDADLTAAKPIGDDVNFVAWIQPAPRLTDVPPPPRPVEVAATPVPAPAAADTANAVEPPPPTFASTKSSGTPAWVGPFAVTFVVLLLGGLFALVIYMQRRRTAVTAAPGNEERFDGELDLRDDLDTNAAATARSMGAAELPATAPSEAKQGNSWLIVPVAAAFGAGFVLVKRNRIGIPPEQLPVTMIAAAALFGATAAMLVGVSRTNNRTLATLLLIGGIITIVAGALFVLFQLFD